MNGAERRATATALAGAVTRVNRTVADVGTAVRARVRTGLRPLGAPGRLSMDLVDGQHAAVHAVIGSAATVVGDVTGTALHLTADEAAPSVFDSPGTTTAAGVTHAAFGDALPPPLSPTLRWTSAAAAGTREAPLAVFVHGLGGHDRQFADSYIAAFADRGWEVLAARYSSGRRIAATGRELADALADRERTPAAIVLVGHSMGGLVIGEAIATQPSWLSRVRGVVTLGAPFGGAPLERLARSALALAGRWDLAAPIVALGDHRSAGIKDLGDGSGAGFPPDVPHLAVVGMLGASRRDPRTLAFGDGMVPVGSAQGPPGARVVELPYTGHLQLLRHPDVPELLHDAARSAEPALR